MVEQKPFPIGFEDFKLIRQSGLYYVDKTGLVKELLKAPAQVTLFTRPRRFGKTLNMSMLKYFFEIGCDPSLFDGLAVLQEKELCEKYMGNFPVISISLKDVAGEDFKNARGMLATMVGGEASRFHFLEESKNLSEVERQQYKRLVQLNEEGLFSMADELLGNSLRLLSQLLKKHYGKNVIILIDEYDVPLDKAYQAGYYDRMAALIRLLFGSALKTNDSLAFAVLTGCLRISKESIFTGLNNFSVYTVEEVRYSEYFGFTDAEVRGMLESYGLQEQYGMVREWYDGYCFGNTGIYCPWDVVNYCDGLRDKSVAKPQNYWVNTSGNDIVRSFVGRAKAATRKEIETLVDGGSIRKKIRQELTYRDLDSNLENLWSILFTTGYLTKQGEDEDGFAQLVIPNSEIRWIFTEQIQDWFHEEAGRDTEKLLRFCRAFEENDVAAIEEGFTSYLKKTISIRDTNVRKDIKENFYHGILLGLFSHMEDWVVKSNVESGEGYADLLVENEEREIGIVIELKYAEDAAFDIACQRAGKQLLEKNYEETMVDDGMQTIYRYGIACYKKRCKVISVNELRG